MVRRRGNECLPKSHCLHSRTHRFPSSVAISLQSLCWLSVLLLLLHPLSTFPYSSFLCHILSRQLVKRLERPCSAMRSAHVGYTRWVIISVAARVCCCLVDPFLIPRWFLKTPLHLCKTEEKDAQKCKCKMVNLFVCFSPVFFFFWGSMRGWFPYSSVTFYFPTSYFLLAPFCNQSAVHLV